MPMAKKPKPTTKNETPARQSPLPLLAAPLFLLLLLGFLYLGNRLGFIEVDWQDLLGQEFVTEVASALLTPTAVSTRPPATLASTSPAVTPAPGRRWNYQVYFTTPIYPDAEASRTETIMQGLIAVINQARRSLDVAVYELDLDPVGDALLAAHNRGVAVRLVTDSDSLADDQTLIRLNKAGLPIVPDKRASIMHNKFVVVDGQAVWTGSWNFTANDTYRNNNNAIYLQSTELAQNYTAEFEEMFTDKVFGPTSTSKTPYPRLQIGKTLVETCFAPEDKCADQLIVLIRQAQQNIRFMAFSFTHPGISKAVIDRARAGVLLQGIFETRGSETDTSELARMKRQKLDVWQDGNPYTLHHKVFILDEKTVVLGSFNFTNNADQSNDENMLVIHNPELARQFLAEFNRVYDQAKNPPR
jgi:phosphatidylserine/phosphatidylglycerophosphate/cardiolipin synthase-like enzyme